MIRVRKAPFTPKSNELSLRDLGATFVCCIIALQEGVPL